MNDRGSKRLRVALSAFAFSPVRGSEAAVGWNIATRLAQRAEVTVVHGDVRADRRGKVELTDFLVDHRLPDGLCCEYVPPSPAMALLERLHSLPASWMLYYVAYRLWQKQAARMVVRLHQARAFDVCHQLTYIGFREPGDLWKLGIPFVWGPISGAETIPLPFYKSFGAREIFRPLSREVGNLFQKAFPGRSRAAARAAAKVFVVSRSEQDLLKSWGVDSERFLETGTTPNPSRRIRAARSGPLRLIWSGLFTARKALPILLHALAKFGVDGEGWSLTILGDGPLQSAWKREAGNLKLPYSRIHWRGRLPHQEAVQAMAAGDVMVHTGLREGTPHVILEALSLGIPVICHDAGGMGTAVNETCGRRIRLESFETSVDGFSAAIQELASTPDLLPRLSEGALRRSQELSWDAIADRFVEAYLEILEARVS